MSEPQFAYSALTLDELRSLAASPQVGTIEAMPQSFRALANRVGEVADLLSHAQADLPNWWRGPAAEQAAATLGRAAAEAREFHDSAMGAATAVGRCAQVVAEQQNQMMNVPDVQEPGVTAVVQRPTTPFEALEAARQDTKYQAAHEQAVQVVNGIAAQYVETRAHLSTISAAGGENFTGPLIPLPYAADTTQPLASKSTYGSSRASKDIEFNEPRSYGRTIDRAKAGKPLIDTDAGPVNADREYGTNARPGGVPSKEPSYFPPSPKFEVRDPAKHAAESTAEPLNAPRPISASHPNGTPPKATYGDPGLLATPSDPGMPNEPVEPEDRESHRQSDRQTSVNSTKKKVGTRFPRHQLSDNAEGEGVTPLAEENLATPLSQDPYRPQLGTASNDSANSMIMPPYGGVGLVRRTGDERNPRPTYLKERKSVWLPDTVAAPPDGIITPDCFECP